MVFDTTSSNTGYLTAACISVQNDLGKELMWLPCRHHIGERIVFHCWKCMEIEDSTAPISPLFSKFKQTFSSLKYTKYSLSIPKVKKPLREKREKIVSKCTTIGSKYKRLQRTYCIDVSVS